MIIRMMMIMIRWLTLIKKKKRTYLVPDLVLSTYLHASSHAVLIIIL